MFFFPQWSKLDFYPNINQTFNDFRKMKNPIIRLLSQLSVFLHTTSLRNSILPFKKTAEYRATILSISFTTRSKLSSLQKSKISAIRIETKGLYDITTDSMKFIWLRTSTKNWLSELAAINSTIMRTYTDIFILWLLWNLTTAHVPKSIAEIDIIKLITETFTPATRTF